MSQVNPTENNPILAAWQQQLQHAAKNPFLLQLLLKQYQRILKRLAYFYAQLASLPRRNRRALQRALATSLIGAAMLLALSSAPVAFANNLSVDTGTAGIADDGFCSLAEAITNANNNSQLYASAGECPTGDPGADTITLTVNVTLPAALPNITSEITLEGGNFYVSGANTFRVFRVDGSGDFTINETTVQDGYTYGFGGGIYSNGALTITNSTISGNNAGVRGGGIFNVGPTVTLTNSTISGNSASNQGGGIYNYLGTVELNSSTVSGNSGARGAGISTYSGTVTLNDSTIADNIGASNTYGGGLYNFRGTVMLTNSTVSGNTATANGGGIFNYGAVTLNNCTVSGNDSGVRGGGIYNGSSGTVTLNNCTVSGNTGTAGGGIYNSGLMYLHRSLVSGNTASSPGYGNEINNFRYLYTDDYNLFGHSGESNAAALSGFTPGASDFNATSDGDGTSTHVPTALASILDTTLALNGGTTENHALVTGSPALDKAPNAACSAAPINDIDQRGFARNVDIVPPPTLNDCDIGAYELQPPTAVNVTGLRAKINDAGNIALKWRTTNETQIAGFNVWRKVENAQHVPNESEGWKMLNAQLKQAKHSGDAQGDKYAFRDKKVKDGNTYRYKIEVKYLDGSSQWTEVVRVEK